MTLIQLATEEYSTGTRHVLRAKEGKAFSSNNVTKVYGLRSRFQEPKYVGSRLREPKRISWSSGCASCFIFARYRIQISVQRPAIMHKDFYTFPSVPPGKFRDTMSVRRPLIGLLYRSRMICEYGAFGGMRIGRGNRSTQRKAAPVPLCPPQFPHDLTWDGTRAAAVGSWRLTAWAVAPPCYLNLRYKASIHSLSNHYLRIVRASNAMQPELLTASLNK
jgi:hypothetical protein